MLIDNQRYSGARPATSTIAGMVSGSKHRNSITRFRRGRRKRTQIMVGTSRTSIPTEVITARTRDARIAATRSGVWKMVCQAASVRGASPFPRVENSNIAPIGTKKKAPKTRKTTTRKICSLSRRFRLIPPDQRRVRSLQPFGGSALKQGVKDHYHGNDHDHDEGQR